MPSRHSLVIFLPFMLILTLDSLFEIEFLKILKNISQSFCLFFHWLDLIIFM